MNAIFRKKARAAYEDYQEFCKLNGYLPAPFESFVKELEKQAIAILSARIHKQTDVDAPFVAVSMSSAPIPQADSIADKCSQCGQNVWLSKDFVARAKKAQAIICDLCVPEVFGKDIKQVIAEQIARLT